MTGADKMFEHRIVEAITKKAGGPYTHHSKSIASLSHFFAAHCIQQQPCHTGLCALPVHQLNLVRL